MKYIFSSSSFYQAYKRIQYFKQYANYQSKILSRLDITKSEINKTIVLLDLQKTGKEILIKENNLSNILVTGGGIIPEEDAEQLANIGVGKLFGPGTPVNESLKYIESWVKEHRR